MDPTTSALLFALPAAGVGLAGKIIFDWLSAGRKPGPIPHAKNGFLTLEELRGHCTTQQAACTRVLVAEFKICAGTIQARLDRGDKDFDLIDGRLDGIEATLATVSAAVQHMARFDTGGKVVELPAKSMGVPP